MKSGILSLIVLLISLIAQAQNDLKVLVKSEETKEPLSGASVTIPALNSGAATDSLGIVTFNSLPNGTYELVISYIDYAIKKQKVLLPYSKQILEIALEKEENEEESPDVVVTATRTDRSVRNTPTRVEVIAGGEISENTSMRPGEIKMLLNESTGIQTQPTSAISNTANIRIQGLDGRFTQVLRDGFPLYSGLSEGLSLVQIAPLDLRQVEIIKGSASTLYGGGAIAGLINLVSKVPAAKREMSFLANATSTQGLDLSGFYSEKYGKAGLTLFASRNSGNAYDPADIGLTAIPRFSRYTVNPRLFLYGTKTNANIGFSYITEDRLGGNVNYIKHGTPGYFEKNNSNRFTTQLAITHQTGEHGSLNFKNSYNHFNRHIAIPSYQFEGTQQSSFSELSWNGGIAKSQWVTGANVYTDNFKEVPHNTSILRSYGYTTLGLFVQNTWSPTERFSLESGLRGDYTHPFGFVLLPRLSLLYHWTEELTSRIGGGFGYKTPSIFTEESEEHQFKGILPINEQATENERSIGGNFDINYRASINELRITVNPLLFYTRINHPLVLTSNTNGEKQFENATGYTDSKGVDVSTRFSLNDFQFFTGYSYTIAQNHFNNLTSWYPLAAHHRLHFDLVYEQEGKLRLAVEAYYSSKLQLTDGSFGKGYWLLGALAERSWKHFSLFINSEDLNDARQTRWDTIYTGTINNPDFKDIYTPLEGRTINGGIKVKL